LKRRLEDAAYDTTGRIQAEGAKVRNSGETATLGLAVENVIPFDDLGPDVREQRKLEALRVGEGLQRFLRFIENGDHTEPLLSQRVIAALQLHELRLAVWSPTGRAVKLESEPFGPHQSFEIVMLPKLVDQRKCRNSLANLRTSLSDIRDWRLRRREGAEQDQQRYHGNE